MTRREAWRLGGALLLGAALALPAGIMLGGRVEHDPTSRVASGSASASRNPFSPRIVSDQAFLDQQRGNVEALERHCRETGESCATARAARRWLEDATGE